MSCIVGHPVTAIESTQILSMLQELRSVGEIETLHKLLSATTQFFCYVMITVSHVTNKGQNMTQNVMYSMTTPTFSITMTTTRFPRTVQTI